MLTRKLKNKLAILQKQHSYLETAINHAPKGNLIVGKSHGKFTQFYLSEQKSPNNSKRTRSYLKKSQIGYAKQLAQREYDEKLLEIISRQEDIITTFLDQYDPQQLSQALEALPKLKRELVNPLWKSEEDFIKDWYEKHPGNQNPMPYQESHDTERGEIVRSKSEELIANKLYYLNIPYVYEPALRLPGLGEIYPDFLILNVRTRESKYLEHFGKMDDPDYVEKVIRKIEGFQKEGYWLGEDFFFTMETRRLPLNMKTFDQLVKRHFL